MSIKRFFLRRRWDEERARELEAHLAIETDDNIARGLPPDRARAAAARAIQSQLFGVQATDPRVVAATALTLAIVGAAAAWIPARRAARVDPAIALREE